MLGYITLGTNDWDASSRFYDSLFAEINVKRIMTGSEEHGYVVWAKDNESTGFSVIRPHNEKTATPGNGNMVAISTGLPERIRALYTERVATGRHNQPLAVPKT